MSTQRTVQPQSNEWIMAVEWYSQDAAGTKRRQEEREQGWLGGGGDFFLLCSLLHQTKQRLMSFFVPLHFIFPRRTLKRVIVHKRHRNAPYCTCSKKVEEDAFQPLLSRKRKRMREMAVSFLFFLGQKPAFCGQEGRGRRRRCERWDQHGLCKV